MWISNDEVGLKGLVGELRHPMSKSDDDLTRKLRCKERDSLMGIFYSYRRGRLHKCRLLWIFFFFVYNSIVTIMGEVGFL